MYLPLLLKRLTILLIFLALGSIIYYFAWFSPQQRKAELSFEKELANRVDVCMKEAEDKYNGSWKQECSAYGFREGCRLPLDVASRVDGKRQADKQTCLDQYSFSKKEDSKGFSFNLFKMFSPSE